MGIDQNSIPRIRESIDRFREALSVLSEGKNPKQWHETQEMIDDATKELRKRGG